MKKSTRKQHYHFRDTFRFRRGNVSWLANHFLPEETCEDYADRVKKMQTLLKYLADSEYEDNIPGEDASTSEEDAETIAAVLRYIAAKADRWIKFPQTPAIITQAKNIWRSVNNFPTAIGVIDCRYVPLQQTECYGDEYKNSDGLHCLNVQATCDGKEMFTSVDTRWPGSVDDCLIWKHSIIRDIMLTTYNTVLIGDEDYDTETWLMTPYDLPNDVQQINYNNLLKEERAIIDRCFEQLINRFPILNGLKCKKHETASDIITACFVLHNIAKCLGEEDFDDNPDAAYRIYVSDFEYLKPDSEVKDGLSQISIKLPELPNQMMSTNSTFGNGLQQHNHTNAIDYINKNEANTLATYPIVTTTDSELILDKQNTPAFFPPTPNPTTFYSTQLVAQPPSTILITNNFGPDESSAISGVKNNFNNSSIRIVTNNNNNNNNSNHTNKNTNNNDSKSDFNINNDKKQQQQQNYHHLHHMHPQQQKMTIHNPSSTSPPNPVKMPIIITSNIVTPAPLAPPTTSTVVLDRINICINNHYGDVSNVTPSTPLAAPSQSITIPNSIGTPVIVSPFTTPVDKLAPCLPVPVQVQVPAMKIVETFPIDMHIDEPDSTTSTHCHSDVMAMEQDHQEDDKCITIFNIFEMQKFEIGEDALVKRRDGRYYLGTVVDIHRQQYLVQFDDKTDYWSNVDELMKLSTDIVSKENPTCLACKRENDDDVVEICERCGRGYHRQCTDEVSPMSGEWMCKRCEKPMRYSLENEADGKLQLQIYRKADCKQVFKQFPYALDSLTWDEKHRVNLEQIYCYCGKSGQFDNNMIQCCKCKQWFHAHCVECVKTLFRGDVFFIFGCSVCNNGEEFLRRIQMQWVDLAHLVLYNMAILKNFQKYHHLYKEIYPFALEKRSSFQLPKSILKLSDNEFKANLLKTLQAHPKLFQCGKEIKKDHAFWGLRANKPPQGPTYDVQRDEVLCNQLIREKLNINILPFIEDGEVNALEGEVNERDEVEQEEEPSKQLCKDDHDPLSEINLKRALNGKLEQDDDDDDKFTSDDEIPIKLIIDKVKTSTTSTIDIRETTPLLHDSGLSDLSNDTRSEEKEKKEKKEKREDSTTVVKLHQKNSRKRKAFTLSKGYKDSDKPKDLPRNICDSSSDENSSSSRGTLDLIIPPPKNFLGINNPFRMVTPKKSDMAAKAPTKTGGNNCITKKTVSFGSNSIFPNSLDLNSKIAALKSSGLFPNIRNSDIAKAAGQPRLVRTIKRRLSAKDIMIGPNQEVRRRRTRPLSSNVEVISTTTLNQIPSNFFPIRATIPESANTTNNNKPTTSSKQLNSPHITSSATTNCVPSATVTTHGRRLRKRPEKTLPQNIRRHSISSFSSNTLSGAITQLSLPPPNQPQNASSMSDLKQSVNRYFGAANRIQNGENFTIRAKRRLTSGQIQYLIEWES